MIRKENINKKLNLREKIFIGSSIFCTSFTLALIGITNNDTESATSKVDMDIVHINKSSYNEIILNINESDLVYLRSKREEYFQRMFKEQLFNNSSLLFLKSYSSNVYLNEDTLAKKKYNAIKKIEMEKNVKFILNLKHEDLTNLSVDKKDYLFNLVFSQFFLTEANSKEEKEILDFFKKIDNPLKDNSETALGQLKFKESLKSNIELIDYEYITNRTNTLKSNKNILSIYQPAIFQRLINSNKEFIKRKISLLENIL